MGTSYNHVLVTWFVLIVSMLMTSECIANEVGLLQQQQAKPKALVVSVYKERITRQYITTQLKHSNPIIRLKLTVDLGGPALWEECDPIYDTPYYKPLLCDSPQCLLTDSKTCNQCFHGPIPDCNTDICGSIIDNRSLL